MQMQMEDTDMELHIPLQSGSVQTDVGGAGQALSDGTPQTEGLSWGGFAPFWAGRPRGTGRLESGAEGPTGQDRMRPPQDRGAGLRGTAGTAGRGAQKGKGRVPANSEFSARQPPSRQFLNPKEDWFPVDGYDSDSDEEGKGGGRSGGEASTENPGNGNATESVDNEVEQVRKMLDKCFDRMIIPDMSKFAKFERKGNTVSMTVSPAVRRAQVEWMKDNAVVVFFQGNFKSVSADRKEQCIRNFEDSILPQNMHHKERGRVHQEGRNVMSNFPRDKKLIELMLSMKNHKIKVDGTTYKLTFKKWMSPVELEEAKNAEEISNIWIMALRLPWLAAPFVRSQIEFAVGKIVKQYPPERYEESPKLNNLKFDIPRDQKHKVPEYLDWPQSNGSVIRIQVVTQMTD
ncbi:hypothetical protein CBR_g30549 [Chara braunii]|uniref:Uncharacterized protein n=1 Tax=Chara braunii TaxID=69332 RepID=A0A388LD96_CHABU|nr:hypothetical protein CBR_g30549 [Chara braunii]|eukprot:GBG80183.1 hypothetical protein CBR_g30549 [Chara braunii]